MTQHFIPGTPPIEVVLRRSGRARRLSLRVSRLDGKVSLTLPTGVSEREGLKFAHEKQDWLRRQLEIIPDHVDVAMGEAVPIGGRMREITQATGRSVVLGQQEIAVPGAAETAGRRVQAYLRTLARHRLAEAVDHYALALGTKPSKLTLRDTRSRWGSCSSSKALMFSWRLVMAPPEVLDYVAAHEVAHLREMNHSSNFWALVDKIHGPYETERKWLKTHGQELHRYRFN